MAGELFPFRYRDRLTGRWVKARYKATREAIAADHAEWEITGPAEIRTPICGAFNPYRVVPNADLRRLQEAAPQVGPHLASPPALEASECLLLEVFLRRYVTYCARRRRFAQMEGAVRLHREVTIAQKHLRGAQSCRPITP